MLPSKGGSCGCGAAMGYSRYTKNTEIFTRTVFREGVEFCTSYGRVIQKGGFDKHMGSTPEFQKNKMAEGKLPLTS